MSLYDKTHPDPEYHAEWSRRYAKRAVRWAWFSIFLAVVAVIINVLRLAGVLS